MKKTKLDISTFNPSTSELIQEVSKELKKLLKREGVISYKKDFSFL